MYYLLSLLIGCITAVMVAINGGLALEYGVFASSALIHLIGTAFALSLLLIRGMKLDLSKDIPLWRYLGGVIGVVTTCSNVFAFGRISATAIMALSLFGQTLASLIIDSFGLLGMEKRPFEKLSLIGLAFAALGMLVMLQGAELAALAAVLLSLLSGVVIVLSRTLNAGLSERIGALQGSFINHLAGLPVTLALLALLGRNEPIFTAFAFSPKVWIYFGGVLGVAIVAMQNIAVPKVRATTLTLLVFIGQVFAGVLIDVLTGQDFASSAFYGGALVAAGMLFNLLVGSRRKRRREGSESDT
jgi:transporter family-2 protein